MPKSTSGPPTSCRMSRDVPAKACVQVHTLALQKQLALPVIIREPQQPVLMLPLLWCPWLSMSAPCRQLRFAAAALLASALHIGGAASHSPFQSSVLNLYRLPAPGGSTVHPTAAAWRSSSPRQQGCHGGLPRGRRQLFAADCGARSGACCRAGYSRVLRGEPAHLFPASAWPLVS